MLTAVAGMRFHHVGIAVRSIQSSSRLYRELGLACEWTECIHDEVNRVAVSFGNVIGDGPAVELVEPIDNGSPVDGVLARTGGMSGPYHIAFTVESLDSGISAMREMGALQVTPIKVAKAFGGSRIVFFVLPDGLMIEIVENCGHGGENTDEPTRDHPTPAGDC